MPELKDKEAVIWVNRVSKAESIETVKKTGMDTSRETRASEGKKDRYTLLSRKTLITLRQYFKEYKPNEWLFEGESGGQYADITTKGFDQIKNPLDKLDI